MPDKDWINWLFAGFLALLSPLFLFPSPHRLWPLLLVPALFAARGITRGWILEQTPFDGPIFLLLFQLGLTCFVVPDIGTSLSKILGVLFGVLVFYALGALLKTERCLKAGLLAFVGGGVLFSILGFLGMFTFTAKNLRFLMFIKDKLPHVEFGLPGAEEGFQPNAVGGTLLLFLPIIYVFFLSSLIKGPEGPDMGIIKRRWAVCFFGLATFIATFVLILTQSRGSWLAFMVSIGFVVLPFIRVRGPRPAVLALYFSGVAGILTIGYLSLTGTHIITLSTAEQSRALAGRTILWSFGLETIAKHPWTGIGLNQVRYYPDVGYTTAHLHNHYIHTAAEMGIPALCALLAILIGAGVLCVRTWKAAPSHWRGRSALGLGGGVLAYAVFGMMDSISIGTKPSFLFWISLALISGLFGLMQNPKSVKA